MEPDISQKLQELTLPELVELHYLGASHLAQVFSEVKSAYDQAGGLPKDSPEIGKSILEYAKIMNDAIILAKVQVELWLFVDKIISSRLVSSDPPENLH